MKVQAAISRIQSGPDPFDESRFVMTFLTFLRVLCNFRLVIEGKIGKEIQEPSRLVLKKFLANNLLLSDAEGNTSVLLNSGSIADLPLLRTPLAIRQKS